MRTLFKVDGVAYPVIVEPGGLKRKAAVLDGENAGRAKSGKMIRDVIGTYYNYTLKLNTRGLAVAQYDTLYEVLSAPVDYHTIEMPYGQSTLTFQAYVSNVEDSLLDKGTEKTFWGDMSVTFTALAPKRVP